MKKLLKKIPLLLLLLFVTSTFAQFTLTFDNVPAKIEQNGGLAPNDLLIITVDNIPNNNTNAEVVVQVRMMPNGSGNIGNIPRITQMDLDTNYSTADGTVDANHSIVTTAGTNTDTFKRTFTVNNLVTQGGNTFTIGTDNHYAGVRVKMFSPTNTNNEFRHEATLENGWSGTIDGVADTTLSILEKIDVLGSIYPNPVSSILNVSKSVNTKTYKVVNLLGQTIKQVNATGSINVSDLSAGMYILFTDAGNARFIKK